ncbi:hypothetical protein ACFFWE_08825 [Sphaerisporangium melleum]|nr:hypothetical protein [Sphaerisporangium melleum]
MDALRLVENDLRIQVVFTAAPDVFGNGVAEFLHGLRGPCITWEQATRQWFDLALAASLGAIHEVHAPLVVMPHGAGFSKRARGRAGLRVVDGGAVGVGSAGRRPVGGKPGVYGLDAQRLMHDGEVVPAAIALPHAAELGTLGRSCPEAVPVADVVGDPSFDRLMASLAHRDAYRRALAVRPDETLVVVSSTWGPRSLFARSSELLSRLLAELPGREFRVVVLLHPNIWFAHGVWQVRTWLADGLRHGLGLVPPGADWRGVLAAADLVIGDHGSVTAYATAAGVPVLLAEFADSDVDPASPAGELAAVAPRLSADGPLREQFAVARDRASAGRYEGVAARITSEPGHFDRNMRRLMYRLLELPQPATITVTPPAAVPYLLGRRPWDVAAPGPAEERGPGSVNCATCSGGGGVTAAENDVPARWWPPIRRRA